MLGHKSHNVGLRLGGFSFIKIYCHAATPSIIYNSYYSFGLPLRSSADHAVTHTLSCCYSRIRQILQCPDVWLWHETCGSTVHALSTRCTHTVSSVFANSNDKQNAWLLHCLLISVCTNWGGALGLSLELSSQFSWAADLPLSYTYYQHRVHQVLILRTSRVPENVAVKQT
jgi:hypothetical protein